MSVDSSEFWAAHQAWAKEHCKQIIEGTVSDPEESGSFLSSYTTYSVVTTPYGWAVRRRFSDFEWLRETLVSRYVGLLVPALPAKRAIGKSDAAFVQKRMAGLNMFLARVFECVYLRKDATLARFLSVAEAKEWEKVKDLTKPGDITADNVGMVKWREALEHFPMPPEADRIISDVRAKLEMLEPQYREAAASVKRLAERAAAFTAELSTFQSHFEGITKGDFAPRLPAASCMPPQHHMPAAASLDAVHKAGLGLSAWLKISEFRPRMLASMMETTFAYESRQIANMKQLLRQREDMLDTKHKAERVLDKHSADLFAVRGSDKESKRARQVADDKVTVERAGFVVDIITKALLLSELDRMSDEQCALIRECFAAYAVSGFKLAQREGALWRTMGTQMGVDEKVAAGHAKRVLDMFPSAPHGSAAGAGDAE